MADDNWDWDLYAVVRGYTSAAATTTTAADPPPPAATNTTSSHDTTSTFKEENDPFSFPNLLLQPSTTTTQSHSFQELQQLFIPFTPTTHNNTDHHRQSQMNLQSPQSQTTSSAMNLLNSQVQIQTPRSRKRKIQQKKMVCHVTAENLSTDLWAWRKYGQKPIKGSPYPRNYYRCSSNKGCVARKQVERSVTEPEMFVVTYTGDHSHPPPTHRNSLAGSTRSKPSTTATNSLTRRENEEAADEIVSAGESSYPSPEPDSLTWSDDEDDILIPNLAAMTEDIFLGGSSPTSKEKV